MNPDADPDQQMIRPERHTPPRARALGDAEVW